MNMQTISKQTVNRRYLLPRIAVAIALAGCAAAAAGCVDPDGVELEESTVAADTTDLAGRITWSMRHGWRFSTALGQKPGDGERPFEASLPDDC